MVESLTKYLRKWNSRHNERVKLQYGILFLSSVGVVVSGLVALVDADLGHTMVRISLMGFATLVVNWVIWSLLNSTVLQTIAKKPEPTRKTKK